MKKITAVTVALIIALAIIINITPAHAQDCSLERQIYVKYCNLMDLAEKATDPQEKTELLKLASLYRYLWGKIYEEGGRPKDAISHYKVALKHDPNNVYAIKALKELQ